MSEHYVKKGDIIYIIPDDELYGKYRRGEAFIDDYGRLVNDQNHRVLRELKHYANSRTVVKTQYVHTPVAPAKKSPSIVDKIKEASAEKKNEVVDKAVGKFVDKFSDKIVYEWGPRAFHWITENAIDFLVGLDSKEYNVDRILRERSMEVATMNSKPTSTMSLEEAYDEKRKVLYHWIAMLTGLRKLQDAGEVDVQTTIAWLTNPATLDQVNGLLGEDPNLLETDKYITLHDMLGRDLYEERQLVPIKAKEITTIAGKYGYKAE